MTPPTTRQSTEPGTEAGRHAEMMLPHFDWCSGMKGPNPCDCGVVEHIIAIETEARASLLAAVRDGRAMTNAAAFMLELVDQFYGTDHEFDIPEESEFRRHRAVIEASDVWSASDGQVARYLALMDTLSDEQETDRGSDG